jgi:hypothetical protein
MVEGKVDFLSFFFSQLFPSSNRSGNIFFFTVEQNEREEEKKTGDSIVQIYNKINYRHDQFSQEFIA